MQLLLIIFFYLDCEVVDNSVWHHQWYSLHALWRTGNTWSQCHLW